MIGKYMAAANGPRSVAAQGSQDIAAAKSPHATSQSYNDRNGEQKYTNNSPKSPIGSMAGYDGGKGTFIQMNGTGYQTRAAPQKLDMPAVRSFKNNDVKPLQMTTKYTKPKMHGLNADRDLSRMI